MFVTHFVCVCCLALCVCFLFLYFDKTALENEENAGNEGNVVNKASIEENYEEFMKQLMFARYFLMTLGCKVPNQDLNIKHELIKIDDITFDDMREWDSSSEDYDFDGLGNLGYDSDDDMAAFAALSALGAGGDGNGLSGMAGLAALKALIGGFDDDPDDGLEVGDDFNFRSFMKGIDNGTIDENDIESKFGVTKQQSVDILGKAKEKMSSRNVLEATGQKTVVTRKKDKENENKNEEKKYEDPIIYSDDYYRNYSDFIGLTKKCVIFKEPEKAQQTMKSVMHCILALLETNLVINDDILILCFEFCKFLHVDKKPELMKEFLDRFSNIMKLCLTSKNSNRGYYWFKEYLLFSNIFFCKHNNNTFYNLVVSDTVEKELMKQKVYGQVLKMKKIHLCINVLDTIMSIWC